MLRGLGRRLRTRWRGGEVTRWRSSLREAEGGGGTAEALRRHCGDGLTTLKPYSSSPAKWGAHGVRATVAMAGESVCGEVEYVWMACCGMG